LASGEDWPRAGGCEFGGKAAGDCRSLKRWRANASHTGVHGLSPGCRQCGLILTLGRDGVSRFPFWFGDTPTLPRWFIVSRRAPKHRRLGLLINFGEVHLKHGIERIVNGLPVEPSLQFRFEAGFLFCISIFLNRRGLRRFRAAANWVGSGGHPGCRRGWHPATRRERSRLAAVSQHFTPPAVARASFRRAGCSGSKAGRRPATTLVAVLPRCGLGVRRVRFRGVVPRRSKVLFR